MARIKYLLLLLGALFTLVTAENLQTYCKCTCFKNSTIIPLSPQHSDNQLRSLPLDTRTNTRSHLHVEAKRNPSACSGCTKVFCREQNLPFCKDATDEDMQTMCFQRDSIKDRFIVWGFILGVFGLLGWAAFRKIVEMRNARASGGAAGRAAAGGSYRRLG
ncbi:hypothetical protein jhhlp_002725 [Lomentospora prolificans]|uniref:Uncharacterized protein n=1 Tax=Lomentospora prolificans TaxID=41688 RepID=A0A2N3NEQ8_9PEZI|nr:hypothetical protein jhhlp_002725 [Lomentospora prolificans]